MKTQNPPCETIFHRDDDHGFVNHRHPGVRRPFASRACARGLLLGMALFAGASVQADTLYWYGNGTDLGGTGTWANTGGTQWSTANTGGGTGAWDQTGGAGCRLVQ